MSEQDNGTDYLHSSNHAKLYEAKKKNLIDMSVEELKAYKETIIEKMETHLPELCSDIDEVIAMKGKK